MQFDEDDVDRAAWWEPFALIAAVVVVLMLAMLMRAIREKRR